MSSAAYVTAWMRMDQEGRASLNKLRWEQRVVLMEVFHSRASTEAPAEEQLSVGQLVAAWESLDQVTQGLLSDTPRGEVRMLLGDIHQRQRNEKAG